MTRSTPTRSTPDASSGRLARTAPRLEVRVLAILATLASLLPIAGANPPAAAAAPAAASELELVVELAAAPGAPAAADLVDRVERRGRLPGAFAQAPPLRARLAIPARPASVRRSRASEQPGSAAERLRRFVVLSYPSAAARDKAAELLRADPAVASVTVDSGGRFAATPSDPFFPLTPTPQDPQWGLFQTAAPAAWDWVRGHAYLGFLDSGIDADHPDLRAFAGYTQLPGDECRFLGNGFEHGNFRAHLSYNFTAGSESCNVDEVGSTFRGHGTHVSGIAAATTDNAEGVAGYCWNCPILMIRADPVNHAPLAAGVEFLVDHGVQVINFSGELFKPCTDPDTPTVFCDALDYAAEREVLVLAAAGNHGLPVLPFPANLPGVMSIGGVKQDGTFWDDCVGPGSICGSNWSTTPGIDQDLVTPSKAVGSAFIPGAIHNHNADCGDFYLLPDGDGYGLCYGTSMSAPAASGIAGLVRSANPLLESNQARDLLNDHASMAGSGDPQFGNGIPNAESSVRAALGSAGGQTLDNRLTPLFNLHSPLAGDHLQTTVPQQAMAALFDAGADYGSLGEPVATYPSFPQEPTCGGGGCPPTAPASWLSVLSTYRPPAEAPATLVPLYRMTRGQPAGGNPDNRASTFAVSAAEVSALKAQDYRLEAIEGYAHPPCTPEPDCIPVAAARTYRLYNASLDDWVLVPESKLPKFLATGYVQPTAGDMIGYAYDNVDGDGDGLIDGFERLAGTSPSHPDSDLDGVSDGQEIGIFPYSDPLDGVGCKLSFRDDFESLDLSLWDGQVVTDGTLDVVRVITFIPGGPPRLRAQVADLGSAGARAYAFDDTPAGEPQLELRFFLETGPIVGNTGFFIATLAQQNPNRWVARLELRRRSGGLEFRIRARESSGIALSPWVPIPHVVGGHDVRMRWQAGDPGAGNGLLEVELDGSTVQQLPALDNESYRIDQMQLGINGGVEPNMEATVLISEVVSCRD